MLKSLYPRGVCAVALNDLARVDAVMLRFGHLGPHRLHHLTLGTANGWGPTPAAAARAELTAQVQKYTLLVSLSQGTSRGET